MNKKIIINLFFCIIPNINDLFMLKNVNKRVNHHNHFKIIITNHYKLENVLIKFKSSNNYFKIYFTINQNYFY
jgi:hypothetical protein